MATRATIKVEGVNFAKVYKHFDGYPEGTLAWLEKFNSNFERMRPDDPTYKFAQLLRDSQRSADEFNLGKSEHIGWGVYSYDAGAGESYEYTLKRDGTVSVVSKYQTMEK